MSQAALDRLIACQAALVAALDDGDVERIESETADMAEALAEVRAAGGWRARPELRPLLADALRRSDAARARINILRDRTTRRFDRLAALAGAPRAHAYGRSGRLG